MQLHGLLVHHKHFVVQSTTTICPFSLNVESPACVQQSHISDMGFRDFDVFLDLKRMKPKDFSDFFSGAKDFSKISANHCIRQGNQEFYR